MTDDIDYIERAMGVFWDPCQLTFDSPELHDD